MDENRMRNNEAPNLQGHFLVADPKLSHSALERSVILVLQDDQHGTFGVALNQVSGRHSGSGLSNVSGLKELQEGSSLVGGDTGSPIFAIHQSRALADLEIPGGIFLSSESGKLNVLRDVQGAGADTFSKINQTWGTLGDEFLQHAG